MDGRFERFDILRGFAIIAVVLIHVTAPLATDGDVFSIVVNQVSRFAVPVFFILSGWGLTVAKSYERKGSYVAFLKARFLSVFPQYILWNVIYLLYTEAWRAASFGEMVKAFFLGTIFNHLYFVPVILVLYVFYPVLLKYAGKPLVVGSLLITLVSQFSEAWIQHEYFRMNRNILNWIFFFIFGIWFAKDFKGYVKRLQKYKLPIYVGLAGTMIVVILTPFLIGDEPFDYNLTLASTRPTVTFYSLMVVLAMIVTRFDHNRFKRWVLVISEYSFYIYLNHYLFVSLFREFYVSIGFVLPTALYVVISFFTVTAVSTGIGWLTRKLGI